MNLVEEYLRAIGLLLPRETRDDIVAELRDLVLTRLEAREAELGRPLTDDEAEAVLRGVGHPLAVAARYRDEPRHVVGPVLYPFWMFGVKAALSLQAAIACIVFVVHMFSGEDFARSLDQALASVAEGALTVIGTATVVAWLVEQRKISLPYFDRWRVRDLRMLDIAAWDWSVLRQRSFGGWQQRRGSTTQPSSQASHALGRIAWGVVLLLWWVGALHLFGQDPGDLRRAGIDEASLAGFDWRAIKASMLFPVVAYAVMTIVSGAASMARPQLLAVEGMLDVALGVGLMLTAWWLGYRSPLASHLQLRSLAEVMASARSGFERGSPYPLPMLISLSLALMGLSGAARTAAGLWKFLSRREPGVPPRNVLQEVDA